MKYSLTDLFKLAVGIAPKGAKVVEASVPDAKGEVCAADGSCCGEHNDTCCGSGECHH